MLARIFMGKDIPSAQVNPTGRTKGGQEVRVIINRVHLPELRRRSQ